METITTKFDNFGKLSISENRRYSMEGDKPFFWLGDTAWLMFLKLDEDEIYTYLRNRKEKGYNVIQTVLIQSPQDVESSLASGRKDVKKSEYWEFVDRVLNMAEQMGLYIGLLPAWGSLVKANILNMETMRTYANFLGKRYQNRKNLIWILGGDVRGDVGYDVFCLEGEILKSYNPERIITYHPFGRTSSSLWFHN